MNDSDVSQNNSPCRTVNTANESACCCSTIKSSSAVVNSRRKSSGSLQEKYSAFGDRSSLIWTHSDLFVALIRIRKSFRRNDTKNESLPSRDWLPKGSLPSAPNCWFAFARTLEY